MVQDYFDFAEKNAEKKQRTINRWYQNALHKALLNAEGANRLNVFTALNKFEKRNDSHKAFGEEYKSYWLNRERSDSQQRIESRQGTASEVGNEVACSAFERIIVKVASSSLGVDNSSINDNENRFDGTVPGSSYSGGAFNSDY